MLGPRYNTELQLVTVDEVLDLVLQEETSSPGPGIRTFELGHTTWDSCLYNPSEAPGSACLDLSVDC